MSSNRSQTSEAFAQEGRIPPPWGYRWWIGIGVAFGIGGALIFAGNCAFAQITPDTTLGTEASIVTPNANVRGLPAELIEGGVTRGVNLFHSFEQFNIENGQRVYFANPVGIANILSRVTGNNLSNILGTLGVDGGANLFFLNPNGIIFGENARLDIAGSFVASTANSFVFENGAKFSATNPEAPPLLSISVTPGLQYGSNPKSAIANAGTLSVGTGQTLTLSGDTVTTTGSLIAPGGIVQILGDRVGLLNHTQIDVSAPGSGGTVLIGGDYQGKGSLANASRTFVGPNVTINADALGSGNGGRVIIWSDDNTRFYGTISVRGGITAGNGGFVEVSGKQFLDFMGQVDTTAPRGQVGMLLLDPTNIEVVAAGTETFNLTDVDQFNDPDIGADGDTRISANVINLSASNVVLQATNNITFNADIYNIFGVDITAEAGNDIIVNNFIQSLGGNVSLNAGRDVSLTNINAYIWTYGGDARLSAGGKVSLTNNAQVDTAPYTGDSGNLDVTARSVILTNGAQLRAGTLSDGNGGTLTVNASESIELSGIGQLGSTGFNTTADVGSTGVAGNIAIKTPRLMVRDGATIGAPTSGTGNGGTITVNAPELVEVSGSASGGFNSGIFTSTNGTGDAGALSIDTKRLIIRDGGTVTAGTEGNGNGGNLTVNATESVEVIGTSPDGISSRSRLSTAAVGTGIEGDAGDLMITTGRLIVRDGAIVRTSASGAGEAGTLTVKASDSVEIIGTSENEFFRSDLSTFGVDGDAGDLTIHTNSLVVQEGGSIAATTFGTGQGGDVTIDALQAVEVSGASASGLPSNLVARSLSSGDAGSFTIRTGKLAVNKGAVISTVGEIEGNAGDISIQATDSVEVLNNSLLLAASIGTGAAGNIKISTGRLSIANNAQVSTLASETATDAGDISIEATNSVEVLNNSLLLAASIGTGSAGNIQVSTGRLLINNNSQISTLIDNAATKAGDISIEATNSVEVSSNSLLLAASIGTGAAGNIKISTGRLLVEDNGTISTLADTMAANAGTLTLEATDSVDILNSGAILAFSDGTGAAGNIAIRAGNAVRIAHDSFVSADGVGLGGNIWVDAESFEASGALLSAATGSFGGNITVKSGNLDISEGSRFFAGIVDNLGFPGAQAGDITLIALDTMRISSSSLINEVGFDAVGNAGDINITAGSLFLSDIARLRTNTFGQGNAGRISVQANNAISITDSDVSSQVGAYAIGNGGDIEFDAKSLAITASVIGASTFGQGYAGNISLQTNDFISLTNASSIRAVVEAGAVGNGGDIDINARSLSLIDGSQIGAVVFREQDGLSGGKGKGGDIRVHTDDFVYLSGVRPDGFASGLFTSTERGANGSSGDITVTTDIFRIANGALVNAQTRNATSGGNISINANAFEATGGGQILTTTLDEGRAGNISLNIQGDIVLAGSDLSYFTRLSQFGEDVVSGAGPASGVFANTGNNATAIGGDISINANQLVVRDGARVAVNSPKGQAGNMTITADSVLLNGGTLFAETGKSDFQDRRGGANITLQNLDFIFLENESLISASALGNANGGNVTIDSTFIIATPPTGSKGSDIIANAFQGNGGRVNVTTQGLFGIEFRPELTPDNDITVSSTFGLSGEYTLNSPGVDPSRGLAELPTNVTDATQLIDRRCTPARRNDQRSSFTITGRGGIPPSPNDTLQGESVITSWVTLDSEPENNTLPTPTTPSSSAPNQLVEAQGWMLNEQGQIVLTASAPQVTPQQMWLSLPECNPRQND